MRALILALCLFAASCVTSSDLRAIEDAQARRNAEVIQAVERERSGEITPETLRETVARENERLGSAIGEVVETVKQRTEAVKGALTNPSPITGNPLLDILIGAGGLLVTGAGASRYAASRVNAQRDAARHARGEPTGLTRPGGHA